METTIILFRHGEVKNPRNLIYGRSIPVQLSPLGVSQMKLLGRYLYRIKIKPDFIYSSPLKRAADSTRLVLQGFSHPPEIKFETDLQDVDHSGVRNKTIDWLNNEGTDLYNLPELKGKIEDQERMAQRIIGVLTKIQKLHPGKVIFVSSHGDPLAYAMWRLRFPRKPFPSRAEMAKVNYLGKGQAWKVLFNGLGAFEFYELLDPD